MPTFDFEHKFEGPVVGVDEVGVGCWAGPVLAAACWLPEAIPHGLLSQVNDSKKLSKSRREKILLALINEGACFAWATASVAEIEELNIRGAALFAMEQAIQKLSIAPKTVLSDGTMRPNVVANVESIIKGDEKSYSIAAASICAKVKRDEIMQRLAEAFPGYGWERNAGYGTRAHHEAIYERGVTPHHRRGYAPIKKAIEQGC